MTGFRTDRTLERIASGERLTPSDERHLASCAACQRATSEVRALEARLRDAALPLASTSIPDEVLEVQPMEPTAFERIGRRSVSLAAAAVVVLAVVGGGLVLNPFRPSFSADPSMSSPPTAQASPTAQPTPAPTPAPRVDGHLVGPFAVCADGVAGFTVTLPEGVYAERAEGEQPACRIFGPVRDGGGRQHLDPRIYAGVHEQPPVFEDSTVVAEEPRTSESGVAMTRYEVSTPETGALAASYTVNFVVELADGRFLVATTDDERWIGRLDAVAQSLSLTEPITISPSATTAADELFAVRDVCEDPERAMVVIFPEDWWTNTAAEDLPACSWFAPAFFEFSSSATVPDEVEITVDVVENDYGVVSEPSAWETLTLLGRPATRWLVESDGERRYEYVVQLGETPESGPNLVARTVASEDDLDLVMAVLDRLVGRISFAQAPPGASSTNPPIAAPPVAAEATEGDFRLELVVQQGRYRAGQPIIADMTLTYLGDEPSLSLWGSGLGVVGSRLRQVDGSIEHGWATTTDCRAHPIAPGEPLHKPFVKSGGFSPDDPNAEFYEAYFQDPLLRLPPGRWEITAVTGFTAGGADCGDGPEVGLEVSVEITVEPQAIALPIEADRTPVLSSKPMR